jgi:hypothetical protein
MAAHLMRIRVILAGEAQNLVELGQRPFGVIGNDADIRRRQPGQVAPSQSAE